MRLGLCAAGFQRLLGGGAGGGREAVAPQTHQRGPTDTRIGGAGPAAVRLRHRLGRRPGRRVARRGPPRPLHVPSMAFEIVLNVATLGILACWGTILLCHVKLFKWSQQGIVARPAFRLFGAPDTSYLTLVFLAGSSCSSASTTPSLHGCLARHHHSSAHRRLVSVSRSGRGDRRAERGIHRRIPCDCSAATRQQPPPYPRLRGTTTCHSRTD